MNFGKSLVEMTTFKIKETDNGIELLRVVESFAHPGHVAVKIKDVIEVVNNSSYIKQEEKIKFLQLLLNYSIDIGTI